MSKIPHDRDDDEAGCGCWFGWFEVEANWETVRPCSTHRPMLHARWEAGHLAPMWRSWEREHRAA